MYMYLKYNIKIYIYNDQLPISKGVYFLYIGEKLALSLQWLLVLSRNFFSKAISASPTFLNITKLCLPCSP